MTAFKIGSANFRNTALEFFSINSQYIKNYNIQIVTGLYVYRKNYPNDQSTRSYQKFLPNSSHSIAQFKQATTKKNSVDF